MLEKIDTDYCLHLKKASMSVWQGYNCDICGTERKEANHWFVASSGEDSLHFVTWAKAESDNVLNAESAVHLCGQVCAHKLLDRFLTETSSAQPAQERG